MKKRLLAIILTICLLGTVIIDNVGLPSTVEASDESTTETGMPASTHTFKDFGVDGQYTSNTLGHQLDGDIANLLDGGMLTEIIKVTGSYTMILFANSANTWEGLQVNVVSDTVLRFTIGGNHLYDDAKTFYLDVKASEAGITSFIGTEFELGLAFEKADTDANSSNDLLMKIYINGKQYTATHADWTAFVDGIYTIPGGYDRIVNSTDGANQFLNIYKNAGTAVFKETFSISHTLGDFGIIDKQYGGTTKTSSKYIGDVKYLLDGGMLSHKLTVSSVASNYYIFLFSTAENAWTGLQVRITKSGELYFAVGEDLRDDKTKSYGMTIKPSEVGISSFIGEQFEIGLAFEKVNVDNNESADLAVRIYINGKRCTQIVNTCSAFEGGIFIIPGGYDKIVNTEGATNKYINIFPESGYCVMTGVAANALCQKEITHTLADFGIQNKQYGGTTKTSSSYKSDVSKLLDGGMLSHKLAVSSVASNYYIFLFSTAANSWTGLQVRITKSGELYFQVGEDLRDDTTKTYSMTIKPSEVGISSFIGTEFELGLEFNKVNADANASNDLAIRIYINGKRCTRIVNTCSAFNSGLFVIPGGYDKIVDAEGTTNKYINIFPESGYCVMTASEEALYSRETTHTFLDFGATNGMYTANDSGHQFSGDISQLLDGGVLSETIKINPIGTGNYMMVLFEGTMGQWNGLQMQVTTAGKLQFNVNSVLCDETQSGSYLHIEPREVGLTSFIGTEFELSLAFEKADVDGNGTNDLLIRIYINGKRCKDTASDWYAYQNGLLTIQGGYDKIVNAEGAANKYLSIYPQGGKAMIKVPSQDVLKAKDYTCYTLKDAGIIDGSGMAYGTLKTNTNSTGTKITGTAYDKVLFGAEVTFTGTNGARFHYAVPDGSRFDGLQLRYRSTGDLIVEDYDGQLTYRTMYIEPSQFGFESFLNQSFLMQITTDIVAVNGPEANDVKLGIWIDGQLANSCYCYILDQADTLGCDVNFNEGGAIRYSIWDIKAATGAMVNYVQLKNQASYLVEADRFVTKDGNTTYNNGQTVTAVGEYTAHYDATDIAAAATKTVVLWKSYDAHADGEVGVKDLVAVKRYKNDSSALTSKAGQIAAANTKDTETMRKYLLGLVSEVASVSYKTDTDGSKVMPIGSWITPDTFAGVRMSGNNIAADCIDYGVETNFLQQKYYDMIKDLGINLLTYQRNDYGSNAEMRILKALELAEANNLDAYVHDTGIAYDETDAINLANRLKEYARYSSFKGIHVTDEPSSANISDFNYGLNKTIDEIAAKTKLLNTYSNLTGFVNLFPVCRERFSSYFDEYIEKCEPKELSYDYYPFSSVHGSVKEYFNSLANIRNASLNSAGKIPFTGCIGTTTGSYAQSPVEETNALTEAQMRWNVNTMLAYGAKGITWFTLIEPFEMALVGSDGTTTGMDFTRVGLIGVNGEQNPTTYNAAKNINTWVAHVDGILMDSNSVAVLADGVNYWSLTEYPTWDGNKYNGMTLTASKSGGDSCGAIAGVFDYFGQTVYYVVNNDYTNAQNVTVKFNSASDLTIYRGNDVTNETVTTKTFNLAAGEAVLIIKK